MYLKVFFSFLSYCMYCHPKTKAIWQVIYEFLLQQEENMKPQSRDEQGSKEPAGNKFCLFGTMW